MDAENADGFSGSSAAASVVGCAYVTSTTTVSAPLQAIAIEPSMTTIAPASAVQRDEIVAGTSQAQRPMVASVSTLLRLHLDFLGMPS